MLGLTGPPGVGKSTTTTALVRASGQAGQRVGVLAVDPSSPLSGGAPLGDRVRMQDRAGDGGVFIRSMASRGHLGGLALVLLAPGMGDGIQAAKAGILEVADVFVVNKADRDGADQAVRDLRAVLSLGGRHTQPGAWRPPIVMTIASRDVDSGVEDVVARIGEHGAWPASSGEGQRRRVERASREVEATAVAGLRERMGDVHGPAALASLAEQVVAGEADPYRAAGALVAQL